MSEKLILVCNDDGVTAPGINALIEVMKPLGKVVVVAPDSPQSGMGHAITLNSTLRYQTIKKEEGLAIHSCSGTPVDCIKLAVNVILDRKPDLVVSGINHGSNASINVIYSGTMSAAIEGCMEGIPSIGFSLLNHSIDANFQPSKPYVKKIAEWVLNEGLPNGVCLNVNIPNLSEKELMGIKICRQARANWEEEFDKRKDPGGNDYFWLTGVFKNYDQRKDTDIWALSNHYVSVVPTQYDLTANSSLDKFKTLSDRVK